MKRLSRRKVLVGGGAAIVAVGLGGRTAAASALSYSDGHPGLRFRFTSLDEAFARAGALASAGAQLTGAWSWPQVLEHCAQSIEYSLTGYPQNKPALVRRTVGRLVFAHFDHQGYMKHGLAEAIPGAPPLALTSLPEALARLEKAVSAFEAHAAPLAPHFVYGALTKAEYDRIHAMHLANHLAEVSPGV